MVLLDKHTLTYQVYKIELVEVGVFDLHRLENVTKQFSLLFSVDVIVANGEVVCSWRIRVFAMISERVSLHHHLHQHPASQCRQKHPLL